MQQETHTAANISLGRRSRTVATAPKFPAESAPAAPALKLVPRAKQWEDYLADGREFMLRVRPDLAGQTVRINELARGYAIINAPIGVVAAYRRAL